MQDSSPPPSPEPRQRWRMTFARAADPSATQHRDLAASWLERLAATGLPLATGGRGRQPLTFGAAMPAGIAAEHELADLLLTERLRVDRVRAAVGESLPEGFAILDLHDIWLGTPPLVAAVGAADYRVAVRTDASAGELDAAAAGLLAEAAVPWSRARGGGTATIDLRPLVLSIDVPAEEPPSLRIRCRIHPERGAGRPDEIVGAMAARVDRPIEVVEVVRERVLLAEELPPGQVDPARR